MPADMDAAVRRLSGLRRTLYYAALSRGKDPATAYRHASAQCCQPPEGSQHAPDCPVCVWPRSRRA